MPTCPAQITGGEFEGHAATGESLWGLLFANYPLIRRKEIKIAWRMTGTGDLKITAIGPSRQQIEPTWGPEPHGSSTWQRPGDEWGTGFVFPAAGCWTIRLDRAGSTATAALLVTEK